MNATSAKHQNQALRIVIIIFVIAIIAVPLFLFRTFTDNIVDQITRTISLQYSKELNTQASAHISSMNEHYFNQLNTAYNALKLVDNLDEAKLESFIADLEKNSGLSYVAFVDDKGYVYESGGSYLGTLRIPMLGSLLNGADQVITDNVTIVNENYVLFGTSFDPPIKFGDKNLCIGLLGMDSDYLAEHAVLQSDYSGGFSSIIHNDGSYVVKNPADTHSGFNIFSILEKYYDISSEELAELKQAINNGETYFINAASLDSANSEYLYFEPIEDTEWYIVNTLPSSFIKSNVVDLRDTVEKVYAAFVILFLLIAALIFSQQLISSRRLKKSRAELEQALQLAEEASGAKTTFLFNMSHDIRTPMNAILGYTDIGIKHVDDVDISRDSYQKIKVAGGHLLDLINDILEMSRIESGKMTLSHEPLDIREAISDVTAMSQSLAKGKSIDYETVIGDIRNPYIYADELHINEVFINIISNAVKYTPEGGRVRYTINQVSDPEDGYASYVFEFTDNGIGMSEEFQTHLFETFSREKNTTMSKTEGTGLGLSIVKKIVDMAGGVIKVHSV